MSMYHQPAHRTPTISAAGTAAPSKNASSATQTSAAIALNMSWQLLVVIVLPVVGGHLLDSHYHHATPILTIVGVIIGAAGSIVVVWQAVRQLSDVMGRSSKENKQ